MATASRTSSHPIRARGASGSPPPTTALALAIVAAALAVATPAAAVDYFACDCAAGADPDCVNGDDAAVGSAAAPFRTYEKMRSTFPTLQPGDAIRFCRGGVFPIGATTRWVNSNCLGSDPCVVADYVPNWASGDEPRPVLSSSGGGHGFALEDGGNADHEEGYHFANLELRGSGGAGNGFFLYNDIDDVTIAAVHIEGFAIGVHVAGSNPCSTDPRCDGQNDRIHLFDSTVRNNSAQGWLGASHGCRIEGNDFDGNGSQAVFDHNIYLSGSSSGQTRGIRVLGNRLHASNLDPMGSCQGASLVVHGQHIDLQIIGNEVWEDPGTAGQGCWGIAVDPGYSSPESFEDVVIRGNIVRNVGNLGIGVAACARCTIDNNVIVQENPAFGFTGIAAPDRTPGAGDLPLDDITIRNNSIYSASGGGNGIAMTNGGARHTIVSNAVTYAGTSANWACLDVDPVAASFDVIDHNICWHGALNAEWARGYGTTPTPLQAWQSSGFGARSQQADPSFADPRAADLTIGPPSPTIDSGHPTRSSPDDYTQAARDPNPDAGAHEWRGPSHPPILYVTRPAAPLLTFQPAPLRTYDAIRGLLQNVTAQATHIDLGAVECIATGDRTGQVADTLSPSLPRGQVRIYRVRQRGRGYGYQRDGRPTRPATGDCP